MGHESEGYSIISVSENSDDDKLSDSQLEESNDGSGSDGSDAIYDHFYGDVNDEYDSDSRESDNDGENDNMEHDELDIPDVHRVTEYHVICWETTYTYRNNQIIHVERIAISDNYIVRH
jgi:hypothetical protein